MATGHSVMTVDDELLRKEGVVEFLEDEMVFIPASLPPGRFPTLAELRHIIQELGYDLEETYDWYVTSKDDFTEIWFKGETRQENKPTEFWFRRGEPIVLDIAQAVANDCGSLLVLSHSSYPSVLLVPEKVFPSTSPNPAMGGFFAVIANRLPMMIERLMGASLEETLFILSQIRQALRRGDRLRQHEFFETVQQGLTEYSRLLKHQDTRVRYLAFDLVATFRDRFFENAEVLRLSIQHESDWITKARMIYSIEHLIVRGWIGGQISQETKAVLELLLTLNNSSQEHPPVRLAAAHLLARAQPGLLTAPMRSVYISALIQPEQYEMRRYSAYSVIEQVLKSIEKMLLNHCIEILVAALPEITIAQYAHEVLRVLLDHTFFGAVRLTQMSSLPDSQIADRPVVDETRFRKELSRNWLYPPNPTKLTAAELMPFQIQVLEQVMALDVPWMVHSNLLEKYGLPPTRASVRALLGKSE